MHHQEHTMSPKIESFRAFLNSLDRVYIVIAAIFLLTSFVSFCPLYLPFGIKTCKTEATKE